MPRPLFPVQWISGPSSQGNLSEDSYHWDIGDLPLSYQFAPDVPAKHREAWEHGVGEWEKPTGLSLFRPIRIEDHICSILVCVHPLYDPWKGEPVFDDMPLGGIGPSGPPISNPGHETKEGKGQTLEYVVLPMWPNDPSRIRKALCVLDTGADEGTLRELAGHAQGHILGLAHDFHVPRRIMSEYVDGSRSPGRAEVKAIQGVYGG